MEGKLLTPDLGNNIFEIITMPPIKFIDVSYEVTFWAQYTQEMNNMIAALITSYHSLQRRSFRIESDKGYWFVAYVNSEISSQTNFDDFANQERLVRYTFEVDVPGYIIVPDYPGAPNALRKFYSAPSISFDIVETFGEMLSDPMSGPPSGYADSYMLDDLNTDANILPGDGIGRPGGVPAGSNASQIKTGAGGSAGVNEVRTTTIGGFKSGNKENRFVRIEKDPFSGQEVTKIIVVKTQNRRKGETVYREGITSDIESFNL
jgi:hypothetical protein